MDWFDYSDPQSQYFLSHAHTDHFSFMNNGWRTGLLFKEFVQSLKPNAKIYCTEITRDIIQKYSQDIKKSSLFDEIKKRIVILKVLEKIEINLIDEDGQESGEIITVRTIPANHIPGAVMFLFEDGEKRALYTGDFRYDVREDNEEMRQLRKFVESYDEIIDFLYVDLTFLDFGRLYHPNQNKFPRRLDVQQKVIDLIEEEKPSSIHINVKPMGTEKIAIPVAEYLNISLDSIIAGSESIQEFTKYLLKDIKNPLSDSISSIHTFNENIRDVAEGKADCSKCEKDTLRIRPTVMWIFYTEDYDHNNEDTWSKHFVLAREDRDFWQFLYSNHSSDYELREFLSRLRFIKIFPITGEPIFHEALNDIVTKHYDFETSKDLHRHIKKSLYYTIESDNLVCSYKKLNVLWLNGDHQRDKSNIPFDKLLEISVKNFRNCRDIFSAISNHKGPIDIITIPCTVQLKTSIGKLYCNLFRFIDDLKHMMNEKVCSEENIILFYSTTTDDNNVTWKQIIDLSRLFRDKKVPFIYYIDLTVITEFRKSSGQRNKIVIETLKNLIRNKDKEVFVSDWPVPYEYSARKREYDNENSQQVPRGTQKRVLKEDDNDEGELSQSKRSKGDISGSY